MTRFVKLAAAAIGAAGAVAGATLLHPRSRVRRRVERPIEVVGRPVARSRRRVRSEAVTADGVRAALAAAVGEDADSLVIRVHRGVVTLRGEVDHIDDIAVYESVVRDVAGVVDVDNLLRLRLATVRPRVLSA